jgi:hypothetical protein
MHKRVRVIPLPTTTGPLVIGPLPTATTPTSIEWHGWVNTGSGTAIVTSEGGSVVDYISAAGRSGPSTHPIQVNGPLTVTVSGTVTGSAYIG